jgi:glutamate racemase
MNEAAIGIFDSGMGGLTVMRALLERLPAENFVYLGDTARLPYGTKSGETVSRYALQAAGALMQHDVKLLVIACNTASAYALQALQAATPSIPVVGVIEPGADAACSASPNGRIAVIATEGTVNGGAYLRAIKQRNPDALVIQKACPLFVPMAEEGLMEGQIATAVAHHYLAMLRSETPDCLVLGCTHFPVLKSAIREAIGSEIAIVDSAATTARTVEAILKSTNLARNGSPEGERRFLATDAPERFARVGEIFLGAPIDQAAIKLIDLR